MRNKSATSTAWGVTALCQAALLLLMAHLPACAEAQCEATAEPRTFELVGYNSNITTHPSPERVKAGQLVEFYPNSLKDKVSYLKAVAGRKALPEWYWVGVNCEKGPDCDDLAQKGVSLGSTGTAAWNVSEARINNLDHPAVIARIEEEFRRALTAAGKAGSDLLFRVDNMHQLDDPRFYDRRHVRTNEEFRVITDAWERVVRQLRKDGVLKPGQMVGLTAHNNFAFWKWHIEAGGQPPLIMRIENPTQFGRDLGVGVEVLKAHAIPLIGIEFEQGHGYRPSQEGLAEVASKVSLLVLMQNEDNYEDGKPTRGPGPLQINFKQVHAAGCQNSGTSGK